MTGRDVTGQTTGDDILQGQDIISGPLVESFSLKSEAKMAILLDEFLQVGLVAFAALIVSHISFQVHLYPDTPLSQNAFENVARNLSFALLSKSGSTNRVVGHQISLSDDKFKAFAYPTWSLAFTPGEETQAIVPPTTRGPIVSFGKVLGNRTTLYKYLNPRLFSVLTEIRTKAKCGLYVLDSMKGTIVYRTEVNANARGCDIKTALIDNWLVYYYYDDAAGSSTGAGAKGYRIISVEFYEGHGIDEKTRRLVLLSLFNKILLTSQAALNFQPFQTKISISITMSNPTFCLLPSPPLPPQLQDSEYLTRTSSVSYSIPFHSRLLTRSFVQFLQRKAKCISFPDRILIPDDQIGSLQPRRWRRCLCHMNQSYPMTLNGFYPTTKR